MPRFWTSAVRSWRGVFQNGQGPQRLFGQAAASQHSSSLRQSPSTMWIFGAPDLLDGDLPVKSGDA
ncbi:hypothetical protein N7517_007480 [Penicillium concentricum]|uniref:Uncharacterized protein n=1 Tax=Penicillium concentricum TaxID=293559 RepID=A0A9W9VCC2_9EURO|nr:uncharacterized protein N7517_007480 [Penicillium concentricum]KAJ5375474.1 hypothetical protein N7517_007480 [Penicillium concentricum]